MFCKYEVVGLPKLAGVADIDVLIATDCISEGQNLQDCDYCVNYDIHWNPVRIIQRFGRIDRIGSKNKVIQLVNFWPHMELDAYLDLKDRVESRMRATILTSTGDDDPININERGDFEFRREQLKRLQKEVIDLEEMQDGVSIMDLGLNEFRLDLVDYIRKNGEPTGVPLGLSAVTAKTTRPEGTIFVLKNRNTATNINGKNLLHPFYMLYVHSGGMVYIDHLNPKKLLDSFRQLCKGKDKPIETLCRTFNAETKDGKDMRVYSDLLGFAVDTIIDRDEQGAIDSLLTQGGTTALENEIGGLDDFELVCFVAVR